MLKLSAERLVRDYVNSQLDLETQRLARLLWWDLVYGPIGEYNGAGVRVANDGEPWIGFVEASRIVADAVRDVGDLWVDVDWDCVMTREPEGFNDEETGEYVEPFWESIYQYSRKDVLRAAFGEVADYL